MRIRLHSCFVQTKQYGYTLRKGKKLVEIGQICIFLLAFLLPPKEMCYLTLLDKNLMPSKYSEDDD